jgi:hypothetical protein
MLPGGRIPKHVGIIMDGNGRWAESRGLPRIEGHRRGVERSKEVIEVSVELGLKALTLYAFSTENWQRPSSEVTTLMKLLELYLKKENVVAIDFSAKRIAELAGYLDCNVSEERKQILARLIGASLTDGTITECQYGFNANFYIGEEADAKSIQADIKRLGFEQPTYRAKQSVFNQGSMTATHNYFDVSTAVRRCSNKRLTKLSVLRPRRRAIFWARFNSSRSTGMR